MVFSQQSGLIEISKQETEGFLIASSLRMIRIENICARLQKQTEAAGTQTSELLGGHARALRVASVWKGTGSTACDDLRLPPCPSVEPVLLRFVLLAILTRDVLEMKGKLTKCLISNDKIWRRRDLCFSQGRHGPCE